MHQDISLSFSPSIGFTQTKTASNLVRSLRKVSASSSLYKTDETLNPSAIKAVARSLIFLLSVHFSLNRHRQRSALQYFFSFYSFRRRMKNDFYFSGLLLSVEPNCITLVFLNRGQVFLPLSMLPAWSSACRFIWSYRLGRK